MFNERWFKILAWSASSLFFFLASCCLISVLGAGPDEAQIHLWMQGMMAAMTNSLMGFSMHMDEGILTALIATSGEWIAPLIILGFIGGLLIRLSNHGSE